MQQQLVTSSLSDVETDSQSDVVDRVDGSSLSSLNDESSQDSDFIPEPWQETLPPPKYGRQRVERDHCVSWEKITFYRLRVVPHFSSGIVERAKRERAWKSPHARKGDTRRGERKMRRVSPFLARGDFHARSRFARSTIPEEIWGTTRSLNLDRSWLVALFVHESYSFQKTLYAS